MCRCDYGECKGAACDCRCHRQAMTDPQEVISELRAKLEATEKLRQEGWDAQVNLQGALREAVKKIVILEERAVVSLAACGGQIDRVEKCCLCQCHEEGMETFNPNGAPGGSWIVQP